MKKIFYILSIFIMTTIATNASGIGYINYETIYKNSTIIKNYQKKLSDKAQQVSLYNKTVREQIKSKKTQEEKKQLIKEKKAGYEKLVNEYKILRNQYQQSTDKKIEAASEIILEQKKLDIIINSKTRVTGGVDCTQDVLKVMK